MARRSGVLLALSIGFAGCSSLNPAVDEVPFLTGFWPFYTADARPWAGIRETRALGPLLHQEVTEEASLFEARPLFSAVKTPESERWSFLYPLAGRKRTAERKQAWLLLLARARADREKSDTYLGPVFAGRAESGKRFGGLFPVAGTFRQRFGFDWIDFFLWPLFARGRDGAYTETQILWPLFTFGRGNGRTKLRVWPLFGIDRQQNVYDRRFYLWPFIHQRKEALDAERPTTSFFLIPLYGRRDAGPLAARFFLFPLLSIEWNRNHSGLSRVDIVWPLYTWAEEPSGTRLRAFRPFYLRRHTATGREFSVLMGIFGYRQREQGDRFQRCWQFLWAGRLGTKGEADQLVEHLDLWPLYRSAHFIERDGTKHGYARSPYLIPFRGLEPDGWDRNYNKLFELYGARWRDEQRRSSWLFGLREVRSSPAEAWESWGGWLHLQTRSVDLD